MKKQLKIIYLDENFDDVELAQAALAAEGIESEPILASDLKQFTELLKEGDFDLIISDFALPSFDGLTALAITREIYPDTPFIFLTGVMGEERAIDSLKRGATDYVLKNCISRLPLAVRQALKSKADQGALKQVMDILQLENDRFQTLSKEFKALLNAIPDKITLRTPDFRVIWANNAAAANLKTGAELIGQRCYELLHNNSAPCECCPAVASFRTGIVETAVATFPDRSIWELRAIPITDAGRVISVIKIARDISEQRRLEEQYFQAQKLETIGTLASGIAHDFNNILTCISGYGQMISRKITEDDALRKYIDTILDAADRAAKLTSELLQFSKKNPCVRRPVDLNQVIKNAEKFFGKVISENIDVMVKLQEESLPVLADSNHLEQVLLNFSTNASDAMTTHNNGVYTISTEKVTLTGNESSVPPGAYALLTISDTGEGMDETTKKRIFEPFFTTKEVGKGSGLGLAVVYGIIKQHGGEITLASEKGKGATFKVYLPLLASNSCEEFRSDQAKQPLGGSETILIAEDDELVRTMAKEFLTEYGYAVLEADNGETAVHVFQKNQNNIDLLLFDLVMPKMNGHEACVEIQRVRPDIKAIIASGYLPEGQKIKELQEKNINVVEKPFNSIELLRKIRDLLDGVES